MAGIPINPSSNLGTGYNKNAKPGIWGYAGIPRGYNGNMIREAAWIAYREALSHVHLTDVDLHIDKSALFDVCCRRDSVTSCTSLADQVSEAPAVMGTKTGQLELLMVRPVKT